MEINETRARIHALDEELLSCFVERMHCAEEVAAYKKARGLPITDKAREREVLKHAQEKSGAYEQYAYELFKTIIGLSKVRQHELYRQPSRLREQIEKALDAGEEVFPRTGSIACQGIEGANSQIAADRLFPRGSITFVKTFEAVFGAVESGLCQFGILPIENSNNGSLRSVYELLCQKQFSIIRMLNLHISHELLVQPGTTLQDIREIYSHEQAFGQCSTFIASLGSEVKVVSCGNTALAAEVVASSSSGHCAAISSHSCAKLYGLEVLDDTIQNSENNYTRFICVSKKPVIYAGANRISLIISSENEPGALCNCLSKLALRGINMSKLESYPVTGRTFEFAFYLDLDASVREPAVMSMLEELEQSCEWCAFLGCYSVV